MPESLSSSALSEATDLLQSLVRIPTVNPPGDTRAAVEFISERARAEGLSVEVVGRGQQQSVLVIAGTSGPTFVLNAHLDTVPVVDADEWSSPPFEGRLVDGHVVGRGAADNKAGVVAALLAVLQAHREGWIDGFRVCGMFVADEEAGGANGTGHVVETGALERLQTTAAFVCDGAGQESGKWGVRVASKGILQLRLRVDGVSSHAARPEQGKNAVLALADILLTLWNSSLLPETSHPVLGRPSMVPGSTISGGTSPNAVPGVAEATIDCRLIPGTDIVSLSSRVQEIADDVASRWSCTCRVSTQLHQPPLETDPDQPLVKQALAAIREITGQAAEVRGLVGSNDAKYLIGRGFQVVLGMSPSDAATSRTHGRNENVSIRNVIIAGQIYAATIRKWASQL